MSACAWCLRYTNGIAEWCVFGGEQCRTERRLEDLAYAINESHNAATRQPVDYQSERVT